MTPQSAVIVLNQIIDAMQPRDELSLADMSKEAKAQRLLTQERVNALHVGITAVQLTMLQPKK